MNDLVKKLWEGWQKFFDLHGDTWLGMFTLLILIRIVLVLKGQKPLTVAESTAYSSAIAAFAYSNKGPK